MGPDGIKHRPEAEQLDKALAGLQVRSSLEEILHIRDRHLKNELAGVRQQLMLQQKRFQILLWVGVAIALFGCVGFASLYTLIPKG